MAYNLETYKEPFWAKSGNFVRGRDPLGVQNSSISVYGTLLPGMTNLTLRLRYYGTYLWLLDEYLNIPINNEFRKNPQGQYTFVRRAELIIAFVMGNKYPDEQSVIGSNFVAKNINEIKEKGYYDIALGADKHKDTVKGSVYWDYTTGALGQYYAGSLIALNLINQVQGYFACTEDYGKELATAYGNYLLTETKSTFLKCIAKGKLYPEDIDKLDEIALNKEYRNSAEGEFYLKMLLANDGPKSKTASDEVPLQRKESLQLFMSLLNNSEEDNTWLNLPISCYQTCLTHGRAEVSEAAFGWYYYYLNELAHYSLEAVFWGLLKEMDRKSYSLNQFLNFITTEVKELFNVTLENTIDLPLDEIIQSLNKKDFVTLNHIHEIGISVKNEDSWTGLKEGILSLLCLYRDNKGKLDDAKNYAINHFLDSKRGNALDIFNIYIESSKAFSFEEFVRKMIQTLLNDHIAIAYNKMGNGQKNLLKFIIEDNYLVHIETMKPNFTNPRLKTLHNFTRDLNLIDQEDKLTPAGEALLNELINGR